MVGMTKRLVEALVLIIISILVLALFNQLPEISSDLELKSKIKNDIFPFVLFWYWILWPLTPACFILQAVLWYTDSLKQKATLEEHSSLITDVRFSPSMPRLATSSFDRTVRVWDVDNVSWFVSCFTIVCNSREIVSIYFSGFEGTWLQCTRQY